MAIKLYVGNLSYSTTEDQLKELFATVGEVSTVTVIMDRYSGNSKGFGFVEMADDASAQKAIAELNGRELDGRNIRVSEARPPEPRNNFDSGDRRR